ncbi:nucleolin 2 isoform X2 [Cajanus cajan]|uniref:Protein gar2 n=1 Tax=Cajanus cajan TaxID=3821 RepID=A0A151U820_CAJCA|nr:nucleolin 2 isoform X2 [Cajanus cajan]XP_029126545.1 nucleolin 2 isoform X2 [Cajanus cajan]XP_029126546.1 nucleolin 2 isoform X2 [Cajanus cajan]KYP75440.1 Protein gar2 [Cajanus cajan]
MVLSNKKLKLKLRAELNQSNPSAAEAPSSSNSLKTLLDAATPAPRLSKREKRRKLRSSQNPNPPQEPNDETHKEGSTNKKKKRKKVEDDDVANEVPNKSPSNNKKKKQKQKNKNKKKNKKSRTAEQNGSNGEGEVPLPEATELTNTNATASQDNGDVPISTKVYVGGIPYYSTEDDIRSYFESCGTITEIDCMTFPETGKFRGIAIISFKTEAAAKRALALDGADMGGLFLRIQPYKATRASKTSNFAPEMLEGYNRIYVGNLSWDITEEELRKFFKNCDIASLRFGMDKETGEFRGYAHLDFSDSQSLKTALTLDQNVLFGRPVRISCAVPLKKKPGTNTSSVSTINGTVNGVDGTVKGVDGDKSGSTVSGKMKRRTCYECGEKGHGFSECPKKQTVAATAT